MSNGGEEAVKAIISIHDVMPDTLSRVEALLALLPRPWHRKLALLVVPGKNWAPDQIAQLRQWQQGGCILAGHGWAHQAARIQGLYHRLHSLLLSRDVAEHLSLSEREILALMRQNHEWFRQQGLGAPDLYVPPAWAMGRVSKAGLREAPFRYFETTAGIYDSEQDKHHFLPLVGFEADNAWRKYALYCCNGLNRLLAGNARPLRISLHPDDDRLLLRASMHKYLSAVDGLSTHRL